MGLPTELARVAGRALPSARLRPLLRRAIEGEHIALCLHRVRARPHLLPEMSLEAEKLDELLERLREARPGALTVTFDDGYADAARYLQERSERFADVKFVFFVCPRRTEQREPFDWDEGRAELATVEECHALARLPNVRLGNHSNSHHRLTDLTSEELHGELSRSRDDFDRLFGAAIDFAIPFGTPGVAWGEREIAMLRTLGYRDIWSTDPRPVRDGDQALSRFSMDGRWSLGELLAWIAMRSAKARLLSRAA